MRLCTFEAGGERRPGALDGDAVVDLSPTVPDLEALIAGGPHATAAAAERLTDAGAARLPVAGIRLLAPLQPASLRDFLAFEDHARAGAVRRGESLPETWQRFPIYYKGNHRSIVGPGEDVVWPTFTERLDFELELACVLGARGRDLDHDRARNAIFGFTVMNDWSARDLQREEMSARLGPAKSKDFATSLGPWIVTADELDPRDGLAMVARVNGEVWCEASTRGMRWDFADMVSWVSRDEDVWPCDVYGSGTPYGGCGLDLDRWIQPGDVVELEIDGIGTLRNRVVRAR